MQLPAQDRRGFLGGIAAFGAAALGLAASAGAQGDSAPGPLMRRIPASGEAVPAVGMGTWITFNVGDDEELRRRRLDVCRAFFGAGGSVIDSSPMYGSSEEVVGWCLERLPQPQKLFSATKVWTWFDSRGPAQMAQSRELWGVDRFDLMQVHNLLSWEGHLGTILEDKAAGRVRYAGVTTSHGRRHAELEKIMATQPIDFVQFTYNVLDREAEDRLLPLAAERGLAVLINRPFRQGPLIDAVERHALPDWAGEIGCANWAQLLLKFILSHPAVTCVIPATTRVDHMRENMGALHGALPDAAMRARIVDHVENL